MRAPSAIRVASAVVLAILATLPRVAVAHDDLDRQVEELTRQIELRPEEASFFLRRAELQRFLHRWDAGVADLQSAQRLDPDLAAVDLALAGLLLDGDNPQAAVAAVDRFLARQPDHSAAHLLRARILLRLGSRLGAAAAFTRGIELARRDGGAAAGQPDDYLDRARALAAEGGSYVDVALSGLDEGLVALGQPVTLQLLAVELEANRAHWSAALDRLAVIEARAHRKETWTARRADLLVRAGRSEEGKRAYRDALAAIEALPAGLRSTRATGKLADYVRSRLAELGSPASGEAAAEDSSTAAFLHADAIALGPVLPPNRRHPSP